MRAECVEPADLECDAVHVGERAGGADLDVCQRLEAGAQCHEWLERMGTGVSPGAGQWRELCAGSGWNGVEGE